MPTLYIGKTERVCCNCRAFTFCERPRPNDALFSFPPNIGHCAKVNDLTKATKRVCKQFDSIIKAEAR